MLAVGAGFTIEEPFAHARGVVQRLGRDPQRVPQAVLHVGGVGEHALGLTEGHAVGLPHHVPHRGTVVLALQVGVVGVIPQLVRGSVLVDQPHHLALVLREVGGELQADHGVDLEAVRLGDVEAAPHRHLMRQLAGRVPLARDLHQVGVVARGLQRLHQRLGMRLGAAAHERGLGMEDGDPHAGGSSVVAVGHRGVPGALGVEFALQSIDLGLEDHDLLGETGGELGVVGDQAVVPPGGGTHHPPHAVLDLSTPPRRRGEVALPHRDHHRLVGAELRGEIVQAVTHLGGVHAAARRGLPRPVHLAQQIALRILAGSHGSGVGRHRGRG